MLYIQNTYFITDGRIQKSATLIVSFLVGKDPIISIKRKKKRGQQKDN